MQGRPDNREDCSEGNHTRHTDSMRWSRHIRVVDRVLTRKFHQLGELIGHNPGYFILVPLFLTALAATGFQRIHYEDDPAYLFSPVTGRAKHEKRIVDRLFPDNFSAFNSARMTDLGKFARLLVTARDGATLLRPAVFDEIVRLDSLVRSVQVNNSQRTWRFADLCSRWDGKCIDNTIVRLQPFVGDVAAGKINLTYPVWFSDNYDAFIFPAFLGSPEVSDSGYLGEVPALQLIYWAANYTDFDTNLSLLWESAVLDMLAKVEDTFEYIQVARFMSQTLKVELEENTVSVMPYMSVTVVIMILFCVITSMMCDCVRTKPVMGLLGVVSAGMATATAFGLLMYCGLDFIGINLAAPFLMLGIGIDDTFVMLAAWRRTRLQDPVPRRLALAYEEAAVSITITSLTDMFSFWVGAITPFPSVQIFCVYTGLSVVVTYVWHVTFFGALLAASGYLEQRNRHGITCQTVLSLTEAEAEQKSCGYRVFCSGGISATDPWNPRDNRDHMVMRFFKNGLGKALSIPAVKTLVLMVFFVYLSVAVWGCTMVNEGLERRRLSKDNSYSVHYYDVEDKYFREHPYRVQVIVEGDINYFDGQTQKDMENLLQTFENSTYVDTSFYTESWLREWTSFISNNQELLQLNVTTKEQWIDQLKKIYLSGSSSVYSRDVVFDTSGQDIVASRFIIQTKHVNNTVEDKEMMEELRKICDEFKYNCSIYHPLFVFFDQFVLVRAVSIQSICIAAVIMCIVSLVFIPNPVCSLWVAFSIISIEIGVVGYMTLWDVNLDSISMINLIMCIGFSVDFSAHISYAYMSATGKCAEERIRISLHALGLPILQGGFSTILGVSTLYFAPSYVFVTFFKTNFLVVFFGMTHGIFLLPVLLSLFGPGSKCSGGGDDDSEDDKTGRATKTHSQSAVNGGGAGSLGDDGARSDGLYYLTAGHVLSLRDPKLVQVPLRIPRPQARPSSLQSAALDTQVRLQTGAFTVAAGAPTVSPTSNTITASAATATGAPLDKDLGLGTSGEDSSESSLSKAASAVVSPRARAQSRIAATHASDSSRQCVPVPLRQVYSNGGYVSDEDTTTAPASSSAHRPRRNRSASVGAEASAVSSKVPRHK